jgi:Na+/melibiose symporter-like transporter
LPKIGYSDSFFYSSIALILAALLYVVFICPESLPPKSRNEVVENNAQELVQSKTSPVVAASDLISRFIKSVLSPVLMFAPRRLPGSRKLQYSMPLVGMALFVYLVSIVSKLMHHIIDPVQLWLPGSILGQVSLCTTCLLMEHR